MPFLIGKSLNEIFLELEFLIPWKPMTEARDVTIYLEEANGRFGPAYYAYFAQVLRLEPLPDPANDLFATTLCLLEIPLIFRSMALRKNHLSGESVFEINSRARYVRAINLKLLMDDSLDWPNELEVPDELRNADEALDSNPGQPEGGDDYPDPDFDPDGDRPKPNLKLVK